MRDVLLAIALFLFTGACVPTCGVDSLPLQVSDITDAGTDPGNGGPTDAGSDVAAGGGTDAGADAGTAVGADGGSDGGTEGGTDGGTVACAPSGACSAPSECCSNVCSSGQCGLMCVADGQPCQKATDCCSLACNGGTCGGTICLQNGQGAPGSGKCTSNAECCSDNCDATRGDRCNAGTQQRCHAAGERCTGDGVDGCCGGATCIGRGTSQEHCGLPTDVCRGAGAACSAAFECCSSSCSAGSCQ